MIRASSPEHLGRTYANFPRRFAKSAVNDRDLCDCPNGDCTCRRRFQLRSRTGPAHAARRLEPSRDREVYGGVLELAGPDILLGSERDERMAGDARPLQSNVRE